MIYNCRKVVLNPPKGLITYNYDPSKEKAEVVVDSCLADEIEQLWTNGIVTTGCCCGQVNEVKECTAVNCPLHPFRFGKNPYRAKRELTEEQRAELRERLSKAR